MIEIRSDFDLPTLRVTEEFLVDHFRRPQSTAPRSLRNYHRESQVPASARATAKPSAVLIPFIVRAEGLTLLLTRRHPDISAPGQICFPGGTCEARDRDRVETALRETWEEIRLAPNSVAVLGELGHYYSHSGHDIVPLVGLVHAPSDLVANPREVTEILEIPADVVFRAKSYRLRQHSRLDPLAHFSLEYGKASVTGVTVCLLMNLYTALAETHSPSASGSEDAP